MSATSSAHANERWDGTGYPDGLAQTDIPVGARIVCVCDAFSAMTSDRPYRTARTIEEAVQELRANAGTQFDPAIVAALIDIIERRGPAVTPAQRAA